MNAEGLSIEGLGSENSLDSSTFRPLRPRRISKKTIAVAPTMKNTRMTAAAVQPKRNCGSWEYASHDAVSISRASNMCERAVPIESRRAKENHEHSPRSQESPKRQFEIASLASYG